MTFSLSPPMIDLLILSIIMKEDSYGYQISQHLKPVSNMSDSALYPILRRLSDNSYVETYDQPFQGRNRKYYRISPKGQERQVQMGAEWQQFIHTIDEIIKGDFPNGGSNE